MPSSSTISLLFLSFLNTLFSSFFLLQFQASFPRRKKTQTPSCCLSILGPVPTPLYPSNAFQARAFPETFSFTASPPPPPRVSISEVVLSGFRQLSIPSCCSGHRPSFTRYPCILLLPSFFLFNPCASFNHFKRVASYLVSELSKTIISLVFYAFVSVSFRKSVFFSPEIPLYPSTINKLSFFIVSFVSGIVLSPIPFCLTFVFFPQ